MSSTSGTQSLNVLNDAFPDGGSLSMGVVANERTNKSQASADSDAPVAPNVLNDAFPAGSGLSLGVV